MATALLPQQVLDRIERLSLVSRRRVAGHGQGDRRSLRRGAAVEFAEHRAYVQGDDPRLVDWHVYNRLGQLVIKLAHQEEAFTAHLLLDTSRSMDWGEPNKLLAGARLLAALGYIALASFDRVAVVSFGEDATLEFGPRSGRAQVHALFARLQELRPHGGTDLPRACRQYAARRPAPGVAIVCSDLLAPDAVPGLMRLQQAGLEVVCLHLLAPQELEPPPGGDLRLIDRETGREVELTLDERTVALYVDRLTVWRADLERTCIRRGMAYALVRSDADLEAVVLGTLRRQGIVR